VRKKILIILGRYLPGYKDGGPVRSIINLVDSYHQDYDFYILTKDRDQQDQVPYPNIFINSWNQVGNASVFYAPNEKITRKLIVQLSKDMDLVYVCGVFNRYAVETLMLKKFKKIKSRVVVAPMGSFSTGAFLLQHHKKRLFISFTHFLGLYKNIEWSLTSSMEVDEFKSIIQNPKKIYIAEDLPRMYLPEIIDLPKMEHELQVVFISRISVKKNLSYAIDVLSQLKGNIHFSIYGHIEDSNYWDLCLKKLEQLPTNIHFEYKDEAHSEDILQVFSKYHVFLFPTMSENYGHVIYEALASGCIPVISNQTPWQDFDAHACGVIIDLKEQDAFIKNMQQFVDMSVSDLNAYRNRAYQYAIKKYHDSRMNSGYQEIFDQE
jgi:glycosyltransferase involved in cell wall biosynthesis